MSLSLLSQVTTVAKRLPARVFLYAQEKWGKSSWAAHAPGAIFAMTRGEDGLATLMNAGRVPATAHFPDTMQTWGKLRQATAALLNEDHAFKTFVVDTANGAARLCAEYVCDEHFHGAWKEFHAYGKGFEICLEQWIAWLGELDRLREERTMSIILLAHTEVKGFKNPTGADYDRYTPDMPKHLWSVTHKWSDAILFGTFKVFEAVSGSGKDKKVKGQGGSQRVLYAGESAAYLAGNRLGLPSEIACGSSAEEAFKNFRTEAAKARAAALEKEKAAKEKATAEANKPATDKPTPTSDQPKPSPAPTSKVGTDGVEHDELGPIAFTGGTPPDPDQTDLFENDDNGPPH